MVRPVRRRARRLESTLRWRYAPRQRRVAAGIVAAAVNLLLAAAFVLPPGPLDTGPQDHDQDAIAVTFLRALPVQRPDVEPRPMRSPRRAKRSEARSDTKIVRGPPTETPDSLVPPLVAELEAHLVDAADTAERCRSAHPEVFAALDKPATVVLRVFVMPDGKLAQGTIAASSGNADLDRAVFQCVQAYANVEPAVLSGSPVGSWQDVMIIWGR